jgi:predicted glycoside hydrolase/deacetylase ChbG (UPF0249 family)
MKCIINGDDFGLTASCTAAISQAIMQGRITDTTMVANGTAYDTAAALAREKGFCDRIGIHFNLTEGEPLTGAIRGIPDFVHNGRFHKYYDGRPLTDAEKHAVYRELSAQIKRIWDAGIAITHADSHHYIHNFTALAPIVLRVCRENGINKIRLSRTFGAEKSAPDPKVLPNEQWRAWDFITTEHFGRLSDVVDTLPDCTEIMVHPDFDRDGSLIDRHGMADGYPVGDPLPDLVKTHGVELISYSEL